MDDAEIAAHAHFMLGARHSSGSSQMGSAATHGSPPRQKVRKEIPSG